MLNLRFLVRPIRGLSAQPYRRTSSSSTTTATSVSDDIASIIESLVATKDGSPSTFNVYNPANPEQVLAQVPVMDQHDARGAVTRAAQALPSWRDGTTAAARGALLTQWSSAIKENVEQVATIMTLESGKPLAESRGEVGYAASFLDYYAAEAIRPTSAGGGFLVPTPFSTATGSPRGQIMAIHQAVGTCALVSPWNFPAAMVRETTACHTFFAGYRRLMIEFSFL